MQKIVDGVALSGDIQHPSVGQEDPPRYPLSEASSSTLQRPPPFSSLYASSTEAVEAYKHAVTEAGASTSAPAYATHAPNNSQDLFEPTFSVDAVADTKAALPQDTKGESSKKEEDSEPPPAYTEGSSPLDSFTYLMAAAGGAASIITQVQQGHGGGLNTLGGEGQIRRGYLCHRNTDNLFHRCRSRRKYYNGPAVSLSVYKVEIHCLI